MMTLTRDKIIDTLVKDFGLLRREATDLYDTWIDDMKTSIKNSERVKLPEFGSFFMKDQSYQRKRRDIPVDEDTPKLRTPSFSAYNILRARVQRASVEKSRDVD